MERDVVYMAKTMIMRPHWWTGLVAIGALVVGAGNADTQRRAPVSSEVRRVLEPSDGTLPAADGRPGTPLVVRFDLLSQAAASGGIIELPLAPDLTVRAQIEWTGSEASDIFIAGQLIDGQDGEVNLTVVDETLVARVVVGRRLFMIRRSANSSVHVASEIDPQTFAPEAQPRIPPRPKVPGDQD